LTLNGHNDWVDAVVISQDGKKIASGSRDFTVKIWDMKSGKLLHTLNGHTNWVTSVDFSPSGNEILSASWDQSIKIWNANIGAEITELKGHTKPVSAAAFAPNGRHVISVGFDATLKIWDTRKSKLSSEFLMSAPCTALAIGTRAQLIACGDSIGNIFMIRKISSAQK